MLLPFCCIVSSPVTCFLQCHLMEEVTSGLSDFIRQRYDGVSGSISNITSSSNQSVSNFGCKAFTSSKRKNGSYYNIRCKIKMYVFIMITIILDHSIIIM